jgi:hypothetical protein
MLTLFCDVATSLRPIDGDLSNPSEGELDSQQRVFADQDDSTGQVDMYKKQNELVNLWPDVDRYDLADGRPVIAGRVRPRMHLFVGRRTALNDGEPDLFKRPAPMFVGKRSSGDFDEQQDDIEDIGGEFDKRGRLFVGKRLLDDSESVEDELEKRARMFVGRRRAPIFVGKRGGTE